MDPYLRVPLSEVQSSKVTRGRKPSFSSVRSVRQVIQDTCDNFDAANPGFIGQLGRACINAFRAASQAF